MKILTMQVMAATLFSASFFCGQQISGSINGVVKIASRLPSLAPK